MTRILVPLAVPGLVASAALAFMTSYSEFFFALLVTQTIRAQTAPVILAAIGNNQDVSLALIAVSTVIAVAPIAVIALAFRHYIVRGYTIGVEK
jgi:multiple sugar transport system permease protein